MPLADDYNFTGTGTYTGGFDDLGNRLDATDTVGGGVGPTVTGSDGKPVVPTAPTPVDLGKSVGQYLDVFGNPDTQQRLLDADGVFQSGILQNQANASNQVMFGQGDSFNTDSFLASISADEQNQLQEAFKQTGRDDYKAWVNDWHQAAVNSGDRSALDRDQQYRSYDPNSTVGQSIGAGQALSQADNQANTNQRRSSLDDVISMGGQLNDANRAANPELNAALNNATALGGSSDFFGAAGNAVNGAPQYGDIGFQGAQGPGGVNANQVGTGALGDSLYGQAMGANGLGEVGQTLQGRAQGFANSQGNLSADELRAGDQSIREGQAARGVEMGQSAVTAEALGRLTNKRGRMMQDLGMADALNQSNLAETQQNRNFQQGVQGNDIGRQQSNAGLSMTGQLANQGVAAQYGLSNQAQQQALNNQNRGFAAGQDQQNINNQNLYGQLLQGQQGADRSYAGQLAGIQQNASVDPWQALTGISSGAGAGGFNVGQQGFNNAGTSGLQNIDPSSGVNLALTNSANLANYNSNIYASDAAMYGADKAASAQKSSGIFGGLGSALGGLASAIPFCWVAREVYGAGNPKWLQFRHWMLNDSPKWFLDLYLKHGEKFAAYISDKPVLKYFIRKFMDGRIKSLKNSCQHSVVT